MSPDDRLIYMANQIARNFATKGDDAATAAVADHMSSFWDPRMKARILGLLADRRAQLSPVAAAAIARLNASRAGSQTPAGEASGQDAGCDAG